MYVEVECDECDEVFEVHRSQIGTDSDAYWIDNGWEWFAIHRAYCPSCQQVCIVQLGDKWKYGASPPV